MKGMMENHALFLSVFLCVGGVVVASWEIVPQLNEMLQMAPFPDDAYRYKVVALVLASIAGTLLWDRIVTLIFAPTIFGAIMVEARKTTMADVWPILMTAAKIAGVILVLGTGNLLLAGAAYWWYRNYSQRQQQQQAQMAAASAGK